MHCYDTVYAYIVYNIYIPYIYIYIYIGILCIYIYQFYNVYAYRSIHRVRYLHAYTTATRSARIGMCAPRMHCNAWRTYNIADDTNTLTLLIINIYFGTPSY